jgi:hypothetical protein
MITADPLRLACGDPPPPQGGRFFMPFFKIVQDVKFVTQDMVPELVKFCLSVSIKRKRAKNP